MHSQRDANRADEYKKHRVGEAPAKPSRASQLSVETADQHGPPNRFTPVHRSEQQSGQHTDRVSKGGLGRAAPQGPGPARGR